jgi:hypothetical protein
MKALRLFSKQRIQVGLLFCAGYFLMYIKMMFINNRGDIAHACSQQIGKLNLGVGVDSSFFLIQNSNITNRRFMSRMERYKASSPSQLLRGEVSISVEKCYASDAN